MKKIVLLPLIALAACNSNEGGNTAAPAGGVATVAAPAGQDWLTTFAESPEGGMVMGNPNAAIKLVEIASFTCPHCAEFAEAASPDLRKLVAEGKISWELRNYVRDAADMSTTLVARCGGPGPFFAMADQIFATQREWFEAKIPDLNAASQATPNATPAQVFARTAQITGMDQFAAQRGIPADKLQACLADEKAAERLAKMVEAANAQQIPGTPTFFINGQIVPNSADWKTLQPALKAAGA